MFVTVFVFVYVRVFLTYICKSVSHIHVCKSVCVCVYKSVCVCVCQSVSYIHVCKSVCVCVYKSVSDIHFPLLHTCM